MAAVRWTVQQAADAWGVIPARIYKWIYGRSGSKGGGRRETPGSRRRLSEGIDFVYEAVPRGKIIVIINDAYPMPLIGKINRPTGIRRQPKFESESPEVLAARQAQLAQEEAAQIVQEARQKKKAAKVSEQPPAPTFAPPSFEERAAEAAPARQVGPMVRRGGKIITQPSAPAPQPSAPTFAARAEPESIAEEYIDVTVMDHAREAYARAKGYFAARNNIAVRGLSDEVFAAAIVNNPDDISVDKVAQRMFDNVIAKGDDLSWRDTPALPQVREAFRAIIDNAIDAFEKGGGFSRNMDGLAAFRGRFF